jgi:hypothetical protein
VLGVYTKQTASAALVSFWTSFSKRATDRNLSYNMGRPRPMKLKETTLYAAGTILALLVGLVALAAPHAAMEADRVPTPETSGTPLPAMVNSPETQCSDHGCSESEFEGLADQLQMQWSLTPDWIRFKCAGNVTIPSIERCILTQTAFWVSQNENRQAPWANPSKVGVIMSQAK